MYVDANRGYSNDYAASLASALSVNGVAGGKSTAGSSGPHSPFGSLDSANGARAGSGIVLEANRYLLRTLEELTRFETALDRLRRSVRIETGTTSRISAARVSSTAALGLETTATTSAVSSTEEINTESSDSSYSTTSPDFEVRSTATPTLSGAYLGLGSDTWTVRVTQGGTLGEDDTQITVYDEGGDEIDVVDISASTEPGSTIDLSNGINLEFASGDLVEGEEFEFDVSFLESPTPSDPSFRVSSTSAATLGGTYTGDSDDTLTVRVTSDGTVGEDDVTIEVRSSADEVLDEVTISGSNPADTEVDLVDGLTIAFSDGSLFAGNEFTVDVVASAPLAVDPDVAFDSSPGFESGFSVVDGSFEIDGYSIAVYETDTISSVLDRLNESAADVTATFDEEGETIEIVRNTAGATGAIDLENDTSGFLAATKLDVAVSTEGYDAEPDRALDETSLSGIVSGTFSINGVEFTIDTSSDSLRSVLDEIADNEAGVTTSLSGDGNTVSIRSSVRDDDLVLDDGTSGFLSAAGLTTGTHEPRETRGSSDGLAQPGTDRRRLEEVADALQAVLTLELDGIVAGLTDVAASDSGATPRETLRRTVLEVFRSYGDETLADDATRFEAYGLSFDFDPDAEAILEIDAAAFRRAADEDPRALFDFLLTAGRSSGTGQGLAPALESVLEATDSAIREALDEARGLLVDARA